MSTISEKLIELKNIKQDIKEATNNLGGNVGDDFSTYADAINQFATYENPSFYYLKTQNGTNYDNLFRGYNGPDFDVSSWDTSKLTSAQYCFNGCSKSMDINKWDLSSLTNAYHMFDTFTNGNKYIDLSVLDFSKVSNAQYMFASSNIDYLDIRNIDLSGATNYSYLFNSCSGTELDLSSWDISNVTSLNNMLNANSFNVINLTGWKPTNVMDFAYMFSAYNNYLQKLIIPDWDMTNAKYTTSFINTSYFKCKHVDLSRSNDITISKIATFLPTYTATAYGKIFIPADTSQDVVDTLLAKYWKPVGPKFELISTNIVFEFDEIKPGKTTKIFNGNSNPWYGADGLEYVEFVSSDESIATVNGNVITGVSEGTVTISARNKETQAILGTATLTVSETDSSPDLIKFRTNGNEGSNSILFINGTKLSKSKLNYDSIANIYSYDPGVQITSVRFNGGSSSISYINEIIKLNFSAANITDADNMFAYCYCTTLDLSDWDTSNVTNMDCIFTGCKSLQTIIGELDLSNIKTGGNDHFSTAFLSCYNLESLYLKNIFKNSAMINAATWCINLGDTKVKDECLLYIIDQLPDLYNDKGLAATDKIILTLPPTNTLTAEQVQVARDKGWSVANTTY